MLRRLSLAAGAGAVAAPLLGSTQARAANGQPVTLGASNTESSFTQITNTGTDSALWVVARQRSGYSFQGAIVGDSVDEGGLVGMSTSQTGVAGVSRNQIGVLGRSDGDGSLFDGGIGVLGLGVVGVRGASNSGTGVDGNTSTGVGVRGTATSGAGTAVMATASGGATALKVTGPARFSRSGVAVVPAGKSSVVVSGVSLGAASMVLATIQQTAAGNAVSSAVPHPSTATITLTLLKAVVTNTAVAWFVLS